MQQNENFRKPSLSFVCKEDWNEMSACEKGRFCGSCQKTVVDFTQKSDAEIHEMLSKGSEKVCGRFYAHQLNQPVQNRFSFKRVVTAAFMFLGLSFLSKEAEAQQQKTQVKKQPEKAKTKTKTKVKTNNPSKDMEVQEPFIIVTGIIGVSEPAPDLTGIEGPASDTLVVNFPEVMPIYKYGGDTGLVKFIEENLQYPNNRINEEGLVVCKFIVNEDGKISDPVILKSLSAEADKEALRIVKLLEFNPGTQNGKKIKVYYTLPVRFTFN